MPEPENIFEWLDEVRERPRMFALSLSQLESIIWGYYIGLDLHHITEQVPRMTPGHFGVWLRDETGWSLGAGWASAIENNTGPDPDAVFQRFFAFVDQYRKLRPTVLAAVQLRPEHQPTGKRVRYGYDGLMDRPDESLAINYAPTSLNHLRFRYGSRYVDDWILMLGDGSYRTSMKDLEEWVSDEFGVGPHQWRFSTGREGA